MIYDAFGKLVLKENFYLHCTTGLKGCNTTTFVTRLINTFHHCGSSFPLMDVAEALLSVSRKMIADIMHAVGGLKPTSAHIISKIYSNTFAAFSLLECDMVGYGDCRSSTDLKMNIERKKGYGDCPTL